MKNSLPKIFVISLANAEKRREHIRKIMNSYMLEYEFIDAVDGYQIPTAELNRIYNQELAEKYIGRPLAKGEIGCYISHVNAAKIIVERNLPEALILEDDILISSDLKLFLQNRDRLPKDWELVHLACSVQYPNSCIVGWYRKSWQVYQDYIVGIPCGELWGTQGYLIRYSLAEKLIKLAYPMFAPIDGILFDISYSISTFHSLKRMKLIGHMELTPNTLEFNSGIDLKLERVFEQKKSSEVAGTVKKRFYEDYLFFVLLNILKGVFFRIYLRFLVYGIQPSKYMGLPRINFIHGLSSREHIVKFLYQLFLSGKVERGYRHYLTRLLNNK